MPEIKYNIVVRRGDEESVIDWGNQPGWAIDMKEMLDNADRITLVQKSISVGLPTIVVGLDDDKRWIAFSRVYGQVNSGRQIRLYAIGWQKQCSDGKNVKSITWVYPNGSIEVSDEPSFWKLFLNG